MPNGSSLSYNYNIRVVNSTRIHQKLGYIEPVFLEEALKRTIEWNEWNRLQPPETVSPKPALTWLNYDTADATLAQLGTIRSS